MFTSRFLRSFFLTASCLAFPAMQAQAELLKVRVSVKVILDAQGNPPPSGFFYLDWQIEDSIRSANEILARNGADWRLDLVEFHPNYHAVMAAAIEHGVAGLSWHAAAPGSHVARAAWDLVRISRP